MKISFSESFTLVDGTLCSVKNFFLADVSAIVDIERRASVSPWSETSFTDSVNSSHICLGVQVKQQWVAHSVFSLAGGEAELLILSVDPNWQRRGIAASLINKMCDFLGQYAQELFLEVRASNHQAINFYESVGFHALGIRSNYYPTDIGREDAYIYARTLRE